MNKRANLLDQRAASCGQGLRRRVLPVLIAGCFGTAMANPVGPQVINGQVGFSTVGNALTITNTPGAIINWQSFSIDQNEITRFLQQNPNSAVLNRIIGQDPSRILGALQSNGRVFLVNPNGIVFGQGAQIDVNGLVASTLNIGNDDFIKGKWNFQAGDKAGGVKNEGTITTPAGGQVYLIAPNVENSGIITSPKGEVLLAAGRSVQLVDSTNPDLHVVVSAPEDQAINLGQIIAQSGKAGIYGALVNQRGTVNANSAVVGENGKIILKASRDTVLDAGSRTTATGAGKGGEVQVLGERVALLGDAKIDASGQQGGGTVLVGGDYQGKNPLVQNAKQTYLGKNASILADAKNAGDGGKVILWGDETTQAYGSISARGAQGRGGFVETSGHHLDIAGIRVDAGSTGGIAGDWLLDPSDVTISGSPGTANGTFSSGVWQSVANADASVILASDIQGILNGTLAADGSAGTVAGGTNVTIATDSGSGAGSGNINVNEAVTWTSSKTLTLNAGNNINVGGVLTGTGGGLTLSAGGGISQTSEIKVATLSATATGTNVTLNNLSNRVDTLTGGAGNDFSYKSDSTSGLVVNNISASSGTVTLRNGGNITQSSGSISASTLDVASSAGKILLDRTNSVSTFKGDAATTLDFTNGTTALTITGINTGTNAGKNYDASVTTGGSLSIDTISSFTGGSNRTFSAGGDVSFSNASIIGGSGNDVLTVSSTGGNISQNTNASLNYMKVVASTTGTNKSVSLDSAYNQFSGVSGSATSTFTAVSQDDLKVNGSGISAVGVTLTAATGKKVEINSAVDGGTGTVTITAPSQFKTNGAGVSSSNISITTDSLSLSNSVSATSKLTLQPNTTGNNIDIGASSCGASTFCPSFTNLSAGTFDISTGSATNGNVTVSSALSLGSSNLGLKAGGDVTINAAVSGTGTSTLSAWAQTGNISQGASGDITTPKLIAKASAGYVTLSNSGNNVSLLAGYAGGGSGFTYKNSGNLGLGVLAPFNMPVTALAGVETANKTVSITSGGYIDISTSTTLDFNANGYGVKAGTGDITLIANGGQIDFSSNTATPSGKISGNSVIFKATGGVYGSSPSFALQTDVASLSAINSGSGTININNASNLTLSDLGTNSFSVKQGTTGQTAKISVASGSTLTVSDPISASGGTVALSADRITLSSTVSAGTGRVELAPTTSSKAVDIVTVANKGTNTGDLELSTADLNKVTAGIMQLGSTSAGALSINTLLQGGTGNALENVSTALSLKSGGAVTQATSAAINGGYAIQATGTSVTLTEANGTGVIAGQATTGDFKFHSSNGVAVSTVDSVVGITTSTSKNIYLESDSSSSGIGQSQALTGGGLFLKTIGPVTLSNSSNSIATLEADLYRSGSGTGSFTLQNTGALTIDTVSSSNGVTTNNKDIFIKTTGLLTQSKPVKAVDSSSATTAKIVLAGGSLNINEVVRAANVALEGDTLTLDANAAVTASIADIHTATAGRTITLGATGCGSCLAITNLYRIDAPTIGIGTNSSPSPGAITVAGVTAPSGSSLVTDRNSNTTRIGLLTGGGITQTGAINVTDLGIVAGGAVVLNTSTNSVTNLAGSVSGGAFSFKNGSAFNIISSMSGGSGTFAYSLSGLTTSNNNVTLDLAGSSSDQLQIPSQINAGTGTVTITSTGSVYGTGTSPDIIGGTVSISAAGSAGISGSGGLHINAPTISLLSAPAGPIYTRVFTGTTFGGSSASAGTVINAGSTLTIQASSNIPMTFNGDTQAAGNIAITAGSANDSSTNSTITINRPMTSTSGTITLSGKSVGGINIPSGTNVTLNATKLSGTTTTTTTPATTTPTPTVSECTTNPTQAGCSSVLPSVSTCTTAPSTAGCSAVLPSVSTCTTAPTTAGCSAVLPSVDQCTTAPTTAGCSAVLPTVSACTTAPTTPGCSAVLPSVDQCTSAPTTAGCSAVLPTVSACTTAPTTPGCSAVLPTVSACTTAPTTPGCSAVLPTLSACTTAPTTAGCSAVLPSVATCTATPTATGCSAVLPTVSACTTAPTTPGCSAVLPTLTACTSAPTTAGCSAVLPSVNTCTVTPTAAGCSAVLPTLSACTTAPTTAGCSAVLPTLSQCSTDLTLAGCSAVLPTLSQCAANPAAAGCSVVVPTASKCAVNPSQAGCEVVLPPNQPTNSGNNGNNGNTGNTTTETIVTTTTTTTNVVVAATNPSESTLPTSSQGSSGGATKTAPVSEAKSSGKADESKKEDAKKDEKKETAGPQDDGAKKNDTTKKMYCN